MPKKNQPTATQELTARYLAAGAGFKPKEQFFALLNAMTHITIIFFNSKKVDFSDVVSNQWQKTLGIACHSFLEGNVMEPLADDKAPF